MSLNQAKNVTPLRIADAREKIRHVFIRNYVVSFSIGIYNHEKENQQRVRINVDLAVSEGEIPIDDSIGNVVCYEKLITGIKSIVSEGHNNLVETFADKVVKMCLQEKEVQSARVRIEKLDVLDSAESVGVEIERYKF